MLGLSAKTAAPATAAGDPVSARTIHAIAADGDGERRDRDRDRGRARR